MSYLNKPVAYLVNDDFDADGNIVNNQVPKDKPVLVMLQANFCGHCTTAKPAFQELANKHHDTIFFATIQADGKEPGEAELGKRLSSIVPGFRGFPEYVLFKNGKLVKKHEGARTVEALKTFAHS